MRGQLQKARRKESGMQGKGGRGAGVGCTGKGFGVERETGSDQAYSSGKAIRWQERRCHK